MNWQCNYCRHRVEPVKEVGEDGDDWPAGRGCYKCGKGEMVCRPMEVRPMEVRPMEVRPMEVRPMEVRPMEVRPMEVRPMEVREVRSIQRSTVIINISTEQLKKIIMKYDYNNGCYPESEYEGLSVYSFVCKELGIECDLEEYDRPDQKYARFLKETFESNK